jgi:flagellar biosynthesis regulator FlaF
VHAKRLTLQRALGLLTATDLTMIQNQYLIDEVNFIVPHWSQIVNHAGDYGPFLGMWLRAALAMSKQYFGALTPSLIQQTSSFIPREEVETREIRLINAANTFAVTTGVIGLVSQPLANLYTSVLQSALSQHHLYTMVD